MSRILRGMAVLLIIILLPIPASAARVVLKNPPALLLQGAEVLPEAKVRRIILDALDRSSLPTRLWTVAHEQPGLIVAKLTARQSKEAGLIAGKVTGRDRIAYMNINYDSSSIRINYKDSTNLSYKEKDDAALIHPDYLIWVDFLVAKIKYVVSTMDASQIVTIAEGPREPVTRSTEAAPASGAKHKSEAAPASTAKDKSSPAYWISSDTYRIAVFPAGGRFDVSKRPRRIAAVVHGSIQADSALALGYSYYDELFNEPPIYEPRQLWVGKVNPKKPNMELVYAMGRERNVNGIVMYSVGNTHTRAVQYFGQSIPIEFFLIDVDRQQVYHRTGTYDDVSTMAEEVLADFIRGRSEASQSESNS